MAGIYEDYTWYSGKHTITFSLAKAKTAAEYLNSVRNTWSNWHLIPTSRPSVALPAVNKKLIDIPGRDGQLDISDYLTGDITYGSRTGSWEFYVANGHGDWSKIYESIAASLHGKQMRCTLSDDPNYYYVGRFEVGQWTSDKNNSKITITYTLQPYKYHSTDSDFLWDPFNFNSDYTNQNISNDKSL